MGPSERGASLESSVPLRGKLDCFVQMLGRWSRLAEGVERDLQIELAPVLLILAP